MANTKNTPTDHKAQLITELAERFAYWTAQGKPEYAKAYEHLLCAFTSPVKVEDKTEQ